MGPESGQTGTTDRARGTGQRPMVEPRASINSISAVRPPSIELVEARQALLDQSFRKQDGGTFDPDGLSASAKADPIGRAILSIPDGRLGVEGYCELQRLYPNGVIPAGTLPDLSALTRRKEQADPNERQIRMIVCGGQTGVDQAALHIAERLNYKRGGIVPKNRATASGRLNERFPMTENYSSNVDDRTQHNFTGADGTLALHKTNEIDGTALTIVGPLKVGRPLFVASLDETITDTLVASFADWLKVNNIRCLNIGGPRHSYYDDKPVKGDIQLEAETFIAELLSKAEASLRTAPPSLDGATFTPRSLFNGLNMPPQLVPALIRAS